LPIIATLGSAHVKLDVSIVPRLNLFDTRELITGEITKAAIITLAFVEQFGITLAEKSARLELSKESSNL